MLFLLDTLQADSIEEIFYLSISNNYHNIAEYKENINLLKLQLKHGH